MDVNDDACFLNERAALRLFASKLVPTGEGLCDPKPGENASFNFTLVDRLAHPHIGATDA
ncbi:hypothetical protein PS850_04367 [Pseudomonas fluorescens]|nr:hypothetical protein PS850_04367 [Pseudomonas fluorescens]